MGSFKRKSCDGENDVKRKKKKVSKMTARSDDKIDESDTEDLKAGLLNAQTIREDMLLLGYVTDIKPTCLFMSLPGCLTGIVPASNVSSTFTKAIISSSDDSGLEKPSLQSVIHLGAVYPCKVIQILQDKSKKKSQIILSIDPEDVNENLRPSSIYLKMVLYVAVHSIEDHGYVVSVGSKDIQGFLPRRNSIYETEMLKVGEVIPTYIKKIAFADKKAANIQLAELSFNEGYHAISASNIKLQSILPGATIKADVIEVKQHFIYMKYQDFDVCLSTFSLESMKKKFKVGATVLCTVLYVHPITNTIYVTVHNMSTSSNFSSKFLRLRKFNCVKNPKFEFVYKSRAYYKINNGTYGFINLSDLPSEKSDSAGSSTAQRCVVIKACVTAIHYMDGLVQMSAKPTLTEKEITLPEDVQIGYIFETTVRKHTKSGMIVNICPGLYGFVRQIHMSDVYVTKPEKLYPVNSKVKCRVLFTDGHGFVSLTSKDSLVNLPDCYVLSSYYTAQKGQYYKGVIVKVTDSYILVLFFNNIQGIVHSTHIPKSSVFFVGQTVVCEVIVCNPWNRKLRLSLQTQEWYSLEEIDNAFVNNHSSENESEQNLVEISEDEDGNLADENVTETSLQTCSGNHTEEFDAQKPVQAVITKVKAHQLNILVNTVKGRVHITELGCSSEDIYPLKEFTSREEIEVYVIGEYVKKRRNYLKITHQNTVSLKECALKLPTVSVSKIHKPGDSLIGFVKKVYDVFAEIWISPTEVGVLDYLHFSENVKFVRKMQRHLKVGLSLKVSVLDDEHSPMRGRSKQSIALTKLDCKDPQVGKNILGLVLIASLERGLILKLPFGYNGAVCITDLTDIYVSLHTVLEKYRKLKYIECHVLEVNHETKYCSLTLRKSRLFKKEASAGVSFCPEITVDNIQQGDIVKGYVTSVSDSAMNVVFGRKLEGRVDIHSCTLTNCAACSNAKSALSQYSAGSVVEVAIDSISLDKKSFTLMLSNNQNKKQTKFDRLSVAEDISWDEIL